MSEGFRFASPWWFLALVPLGLLVWRIAGRRGGAPALVFSAIGALGPGVRPARGGPGRWLLTARACAGVFLVLAMARPQVQKSETREDARGINIVLVLDFSGTMKTKDFVLDGRRVSRSLGLKQISAEFIRSRPNDRVGVVSFDREASLVCPLTLDHDWLLERLKLEINGSGTAIGPALLVAADHLQEHTNETRVMVLMTDAENITDSPDPDRVAEALRPVGIRMHCVQILSPDQGIPAGDLSELLTHATARTGGGFYRVRGGADLRAVYATIDKLEKQKLSDRKQKAWRELFPWPAMAGLIVLFIGQLLGDTLWRRLP